MKTPLAPRFVHSLLLGSVLAGGIALAQPAQNPAGPPPNQAGPGSQAPAPAAQPPAEAPAPAGTTGNQATNNGAPNPPPNQPGLAGFGGIITGASTAEAASFAAGGVDFRTVETPATGLGPIFNNVSCLACHSAAAPGGASAITVTRFGESTNGVFNPLTALDGTLLHARAIAPALLEKVPAQANVTTLRLTTPLFGAGLIEAIPDATIEANAAAPKAFAVGGRVAVVTDVATGESRVGRFGWKAQHATLLSFSGDALNNEIGITNRLFPKAAAPDGNEALLAEFVSPSAPIEDQPNSAGLSEIDRVANFMRLLAPPPGSTPTSAAGIASAAAGKTLFNSLSCASCHTPTMNTGANSSAALANKEVALYSDLLLHDMGSLGDGIAQGDAGTTEIRTSPLWGLSARPRYLHDGRAATVTQAIVDHAGQGALAKAEWNQLSKTQQGDLLAFLSTL